MYQRTAPSVKGTPLVSRHVPLTFRARQGSAASLKQRAPWPLAASFRAYRTFITKITCGCFSTEDPAGIPDDGSDGPGWFAIFHLKVLTTRVVQVVAPMCPEVVEVCRNSKVAFDLRVLSQPFALAYPVPYETRQQGVSNWAKERAL